MGAAGRTCPGALEGSGPGVDLIYDGRRTRCLQRAGRPAAGVAVRASRVLVAAIPIAAALSVACVHLIDPRQAANTDIGLQVWAQVVPIEVSVRDTVTRLRIRVSAKNPGRDTIKVNNGGPPCSVPLDPADGRYLMHSMRIADENSDLDAGPGGDVCGQTLLTFPPRRTRSVDFYITMTKWKAGGWPLTPQQYRVRSYFAGYEGYSTVFTLNP